jgi:ferrochelatase
MRTAIVLFNLGGPDRPDSVRPFLFNLFSDPAIIRLPWPLRPLLARLISNRRAPIARAIYARIGGGSPIVPNTEIQAAALDGALGDGFKSFIAMRYWHPFAADALADVMRFQPQRVVLLPLYPQFSTTTTGSSVTAWRHAAARRGFDVPTTLICCWPLEAGFVTAVAERVLDGLRAVPAEAGPARVLFSAHGLPKRIVAAGDPYQWQIEQSVAAVTAALGIPDLDYVLCYQSRVGRLEWIGPSTDSEIRRAGADQRPVVVVPIAFVSEHSETLVELDLEYGELAHECGIPAYIRVPTVDAMPSFVAGLARLVRAASTSGGGVCSGTGNRICPRAAADCPHHSKRPS